VNRSRRLVPILAAAALTLATATAVGAAEKAGCPADDSGWRLTTPLKAAREFFPFLLPGQFATVREFADVISTNDDTNGDGLICIRRDWGDELNPNSNWYGIHKLSVIDNNAAAQVVPES
jgi:hypothetical protein